MEEEDFKASAARLRRLDPVRVSAASNSKISGAFSVIFVIVLLQIGEFHSFTGEIRRTYL